MNTLAELNEYLSKSPDKKYACRYLEKRNPNLWDLIRKETSFLPDNALPKQRCWHILNNIYERPTCPTTGEYTAWFENRYLKYISQSAKANDTGFQTRCRSSYEKRTGHKGHWSSDPELIDRKRATFYSNIDTHLTQNFTITRAKDSAWHQSVQATWTKDKRESFGLQMIEQWNDYSEDKKAIHIEKLREHARAYWDDGRGAEFCKAYWTEERRLEHSLKTRKPFTVAREYYVAVNFWTMVHWKMNNALFNPEGLERSYWGNHIDHILSVRDGFTNNIPPEIVGHWTNLRMIPRLENQRKNARSDRTIEEAINLYLSSDL